MTDHFQRLWGQGYRRLVPIIPPAAPVSERSTLFKRIGTRQDGRGKTPGTKGRDGLWSSFDWAAYEADERDLARWAAMGAGVGIKTGAGLYAIDADTLDTTHAVTIRDAIGAALGRLPVRVGQSPKALYLCRVDGPLPYMRIDFGPNIAGPGEGPRFERVEVLGGGQQFVAEGTHPKTGKPYTWPRDLVPYDDLPVFQPGQIIALLEDLRTKLPAASRVITEGAGNDVSQSSLTGPLEAVRKAVRATPNTSNHFPSRESYRDYGYAIKAALPDHPDEARNLYQEWAARWVDGENDPEVVEADWRRMKPPFRRGAQWLYELAETYGDFDRASIWFAPIDEEIPNLFSEASTSESPTPPPLRAGRVTLDDLSNLPPREWLYGNKILRKYVTFIASPGGVGKTALIFALALACAARQALLHDQPRGRRPLRVWIYNLEDDIVELRRRLVAALMHYGLPPSTLENIRINSGRDRSFKIVKLGQSGGYVVQPDYEAVVAEIEREQIDIAIFDPFLRTHGVPENENEAQDEVMRLFAQVAERTGCGIVLVHHTKKGAVAGDMDSLRGGSTQGGSARAAFTLAPMQAEEAARLGIPEAERRLYIRIDDAKNNMAPPIAKAEWLRLVSHKLGNATEDYPTGDSVQVVAKWSPPSAWDGILGATEPEILARLGAGMDNGERYSMRAQDKDRWAGLLLVDEFDRSPQQAKEILETWEREGRIVVKDYMSEKQRKNRRGIFLPDVENGGVFD